MGMGRDRKRGDLLTVPGLFDVSPPCFEGTWSTLQDQVAGMPASRSAYGDADSGMLSPVQGHTRLIVPEQVCGTPRPVL